MTLPIRKLSAYLRVNHSSPRMIWIQLQDVTWLWQNHHVCDPIFKAFFSMFFRSATSLRFINLLDLRGLTIATDVETNEVALVFDWVVATKVFHVFFWRWCWLSHFNSTIMKYLFLEDQCQFTFKRCFCFFSQSFLSNLLKFFVKWVWSTNWLADVDRSFGISLGSKQISLASANGMSLRTEIFAGKPW